MLTAWKKTPESSRPPLRALARELGTSHQLLAFYLNGLEKWRGEEYWRRAKEIRACAGLVVAEFRSAGPLSSSQLNHRTI